MEILVEYFGPYSPTAKGFRTIGGPNELFNSLTYSLRGRFRRTQPQHHAPRKGWVHHRCLAGYRDRLGRNHGRVAAEGDSSLPDTQVPRPSSLALDGAPLSP